MCVHACVCAHCVDWEWLALTTSEACCCLDFTGFSGAQSDLLTCCEPRESSETRSHCLWGLLHVVCAACREKLVSGEMLGSAAVESWVAFHQVDISSVKFRDVMAEGFGIPSGSSNCGGPSPLPGVVTAVPRVPPVSG